jgi:hypothetical protein
MTFKATSEAENYLARTGSSSTRPMANGRIDMIPPDARAPEEYYRSIRDQYVAMNERFQANQRRLTELRAHLLRKLPLQEYEAVKAEYEALRPQQTVLQAELSRHRATVHAAGADAFGIVFKDIAKRILDNAVFMKIINEAEAVLGRPEHEIKKSGYHGAPGRSHGEKLKRRRQRSREQRVQP